MDRWARSSGILWQTRHIYYQHIVQLCVRLAVYRKDPLLSYSHRDAIDDGDGG